MKYQIRTGEVQSYLNEKGFSFRTKGDDLHLKSCPFCGRRDFHISASSGLFQCFSLKHCGKTGGFLVFKRLLGDKTFPPSNEMFDVVNENPPGDEEKRSLDISILYHSLLTSSLFYWEECLQKDSGAREEWLSRKIRKETLRDFRVGYWPKEGGIVEYLKGKGFLLSEIKNAGIANEEGKDKYKDVFVLPVIENGIIRAIRFKVPKWRKGKGFSKGFCLRPKEGSLGSHLIKHPKMNEITKRDDVYLCEGEPDVYTLYQVGLTAIGLPGVGIFKKQWFKYLLPAGNIYVCFDSDEAGDKGFSNIIKRVEEAGYIKHFTRKMLPFHDLNDFYVKCGGDRVFVEKLKRLPER